MDQPNGSAVSLVTSKDWTLESVAASGPRFKTVERISANSGTPEQIASAIKDYEQRGVPLVVQDIHGRFDWPEFFTPQWLESHYGSQMVKAHNVHGERLDKELSVTEFINSMRNTPRFAHQGERERLYGKDMHCPTEWRNWIKTSGVLPDVVIPGTTGDVLPETVETLMSYLGVSDTFTPWHKDPCASYGQNIMCYTENGGSSFWFMTNSSDCGAVTDYFRGLGHELDWEDHVATLEELAKAPFDVYILEQKLGDLVLVPPRSFHQVINAGGITIKVSWSRMSIRSLEIALYHELPIYQRVCRPEIYRVKRTIYDTLVQRTAALNTLQDAPDSTFDSVNPLCKEIDRLILLLDDVLEQEYSVQFRKLRKVTNSFAPDGHGHACDFCGADIFLSSFQCDSCSAQGSSGDPICLCPTCVVEGRTCKCGSMVPVQSGNFRELLGNRNNAMVKLRDARKAEFYEDEPDELSDQHLIDSVATTFQAACLLMEKRREILLSQRATRTCTVIRKKDKSHVVPGWQAIMCKDCHSGKCFVHILEAGIHSSETLMTVDHDKTHGKWHSIHTNRQKRYENAVPGLLQAMKSGDPTAITDRLVYFARTFRTPRPLNEWISFGFYDRKIPNPEEVDELDPDSTGGPESTNSQIRGETPAQRLSRRPHSGSPAVSVAVEDPSRKRKRASKTPGSGVEPGPSRSKVHNQASELLSQAPQSSKTQKFDCVLITTLPPVPYRKTVTVPPETSGDEDQSSQAKTRARGREKRRGKRREVVSALRASVRSNSESLADQSMRSQSHSVSSLRRPLFEPEADSDPIEVEEDPVKVEPDEVDDSDEIPGLPASRRRKRVESPTSPVGLPPPSSSLPSPHPDKLPYYTIVNTKHRQPGSGVRFAPHQREIAKTPSSMYRSQAHQPVAGPSNPIMRLGPPTRRLPARPEPKLHPVTSLHPPRPPPPGLAALEARMNTYEARINAFEDENQKLRDELATAKNELAGTRDELAAVLARTGATEHGLQNLEVLEPRLDEMRDNYERLSNLLRGDHLFDSEKFRTAIHSEVKVSFGYYWPSVKADMKAHLWKDLPPPVKDFLGKEMGKLAEQVESIRSQLVALQQQSATGGDVQNGDPAITEPRRVVESEAAMPEAGTAQDFERAQRNSISSDPGLTPNNTGNTPPPNFPSNFGSHLPDDPRRGAETSPAASHQNLYPPHQGPDDEVNNPLRAGPTRDPRRSVAPSRPPLSLPPAPVHSLYPGPLPSQSTTLCTAHKPILPLTSAPPTPTLPQSFHGMHPSRVAQLEINALSPTINNPQAPSPRFKQSTPIHMSLPESASLIQSQPPVGMHPDRIGLLSAPIRPPSALTSTQFPPRATPNGPPPDEHLVDCSWSQPTLLSERNATTPPRDVSIPSSSRFTSDDVTASTTPGLPPLVSFTTPSDDQYAPRSPTQSEGGKRGQKRKASEVFPLPERPEFERPEFSGASETGNYNDTNGPGVAKTVGKRKKRRGKRRVTNAPGPPNLRHREGKTRGVNDGNTGYDHEDGEVLDEPESGKDSNHNPA